MKPFNEREYNKMCAEFLGLTVIEAGTRAIGTIKHPEVSEAFLYYDTDWNSIIEVIQRIYPIVNGERYVVVPVVCRMNNLRQILGSCKKQLVVQAIWEFLNWYNNQTNNEVHN